MLPLQFPLEWCRVDAKFEDFGKNGESGIHPIQMGERVNENSESVNVWWNSKRIQLVRKRKDIVVGSVSF